MLNKPSTFPFNISSYLRDMITFNHLSDITKSRLFKNILFCFIFKLISLKSDIENSVSCVSNKYTTEQVKILYNFLYFFKQKLDFSFNISSFLFSMIVSENFCASFKH